MTVSALENSFNHTSSGESNWSPLGIMQSRAETRQTLVITVRREPVYKIFPLSFELELTFREEGESLLAISTEHVTRKHGGI